jgi:manganese oxidase
MFQHPSFVALFIGACFLPGAPQVQDKHVPAITRQSEASRGKTRTYYIAADEIDWNYAPAGKNLVTGEAYHFQGNPGSRGMINPDYSTYRKAIFREYSDESFKNLKQRSEEWQHLGIVGPLIRAEVGDTIRIFFKNNASHSYSLHAHGLFYAKNSEGAPYQDETSGEAKKDDAVPPGGSYTYVWEVPERAGPAEGDVSSTLWP